jgi:anthranilate 1,2-dioxygenase small subunit
MARLHGDLMGDVLEDSDFARQHHVENLLADYVHCIDDDRLEEWPGFFIETGIYRVITRENHELGLPVGLIYCDGMGMLKDRISALRGANIYEPHGYRHMIGATRILGVESAEYRVQSNFTVVRTMHDGDMSVFACGRYLDRIVERDGALKFAERLVILDSRRVDTLMVIPI